MGDSRGGSRQKIVGEAGIVGLVASAGGIAAVTTVLGGLPADLGVPVLVVQHLEAHRPSHLAEILSRGTALDVVQAESGAELVAGRVYVAPPGRHLVVADPGVVGLSDDPPEHFVRPSADVLFTSMADHYREGVVAVVLSGSGIDGSGGVRRVSAAGGAVLAQDEATSDHFGMPGAAIASGVVDRVLPVGELAAAIADLVRPRQ